MTSSILELIPKKLFDRFRESEDQTDLDLAKKNWRSMACMVCGACCCSSVVPVTGKDFDSFYQRLNLKQDKCGFAGIFLADSETKAPHYTIETGRYGGRCLFLGKNGHFECSVWNERLNVCTEFLCFEMINFSKWLRGLSQAFFEPVKGNISDEEWLRNFTLLINKVREAPGLSVFNDDAVSYARLLNSAELPSYFDQHPDKFNKKSG
ncbi:hypothetical protein MNBD_NITROSPINAE04-1854 [hydrothermal vent metagenome]|uniref:YkgJ family cysteine cluster protein n=1 Tax=hydrothermal vent metagenome TaxID=652676 RepID=A0A3B1CIZ9_9ZZZZ